MNDSRLTVEAVTARRDLVGGEIRLPKSGEFGRITNIYPTTFFGRKAIKVVCAMGLLPDSFSTGFVVAPGHVLGHRVAKNRLGRVRLVTGTKQLVLIPARHPSIRGY